MLKFVKYIFSCLHDTLSAPTAQLNIIYKETLSAPQPALRHYMLKQHNKSINHCTNRHMFSSTHPSGSPLSSAFPGKTCCWPDPGNCTHGQTAPPSHPRTPPPPASCCTPPPCYSQNTLRSSGPPGTISPLLFSTALPLSPAPLHPAHPCRLPS